MTTNYTCPYCSSHYQHQVSFWLYCYEHKPIEVIWRQPDSILMYVPYDGTTYGMMWFYTRLTLWNANELSQRSLLKADIPPVSPEQAPALLKRLLNNLAFA